MASTDHPHHPERETVRYLEQRLLWLEQLGQHECAFALRMEVADWLLADGNANLSAPLAH